MRPVCGLCGHRSVRAEEIHGGLSARRWPPRGAAAVRDKSPKKFGILQKTGSEIRALDGKQEKAPGLRLHPSACYSGRQRRPRKGLRDFGRKSKQGLQKNFLDFSVLHRLPPDSTRKCRPYSH